MSEKVFISHSSRDKDCVRTLKRDLDVNGVERLWLDEEDMDLGDVLDDELTKALNESDIFIIILSNDSLASKWVQKELAKAIENKKAGITSKIIPIMYKECTMPDSLSGLIYADLSKETRTTDGTYINFSKNSKVYPEVIGRIVRSIKRARKKP